MVEHDAIVALYATVPEDFIAERNELAARLKDGGDPEGARLVKALRRPTVAAWAVDALAREHARDLEALIRAGEDLASAQRQAAAGEGAERLREATEARRALTDGLVRAAAEALDGAAMPAPRATLDKVANTLMAIAFDSAAAERMRAGELDKELPAPAGFGDERLDAALLASVTELPRADASVTPQQQRKERERERRIAKLSSEADALEGEATRLERTAKDAEAKAGSARKAAATARRRADAARRKAEKAEA